MLSLTPVDHAAPNEIATRNKESTAARCILRYDAEIAQKAERGDELGLRNTVITDMRGTESVQCHAKEEEAPTQCAAFLGNDRKRFRGRRTNTDPLMWAHPLRGCWRT